MYQEEWLQCHRIDQERSIRDDKKKVEQIEKQGHHGFSFKRKKKADSKGTEQAETAEEDK